jgi:hypothetical protein
MDFARVLGGIVLTAVAAGASLALPASAQQLFKCGATYQDRPCASEDTQQRLSHASGKFSIRQVNADTDADCAAMAAGALPLWTRAHKGESYASLKAEIDATAMSRYDKSRLRDVLLALGEYQGTSRDVQSQLESQCMSYKRLRGIPTEQDMTRASRLRDARIGAADAQAQQWRDQADEQRLRAEEQRIAYEDHMRARIAAASAARAAAAAAARDAGPPVYRRRGD